jgi:monoamine oxidase
MGRTAAFDSLIRSLQEARRRNLAAEPAPPPLTKEQARWTRRRFMRAAAAAGGAATVASVLPRLPSAIGRGLPRVVVVGAGRAGLTAAYQLKKAGIEATVFEARRRLGGRILSVEGAVGEGLITELGATLINSDHDDMLSLIDEFDLELFNREKDARRFPYPGTAYYFEGRRLDEKQIAEALRPLAEQITADADRLDADFDAVAKELDQLSVKEYLDLHADKIGAPFVRTLLEHTMRTEYGVEPQDASALQLIFVLPTVAGNRVELLGTSDEKFMVQGGTSKIIEALGAALTRQIELHRVLRRIEAEGAGFRLIFAPDHEIEADYVVIAIPFTCLREMQIQVDLPVALRAFIQEVDLGDNEHVIAGFSERFWQTKDGFVLGAWTDLGFTEVWDATQRQVERTDAALTFFLGGAPDRARRPAGRRTEIRRSSRGLRPRCRSCQERTLRPLALVQRSVRARCLYQLQAGPAHGLRRVPLHRIGRSRRPPGRPRRQSRVRRRAPQRRVQRYMNGAAETGRLAAQVVLDRIEAEWATATAPARTPVGCPLCHNEAHLWRREVRTR